MRPVGAGWHPWHDLSDLAEARVYDFAGIRAVGRISCCSRHHYAAGSAHLEQLVGPAVQRLLSSCPALKVLPNDVLYTGLWNDDLCRDFALAFHRFPCIHSFEIKRGFISDSGAEALALAIQCDSSRRRRLFGPYSPYRHRLDLANNNVTTLAAPLISLVLQGWTIRLSDNKLTASEANYEALEEIHTRQVDSTFSKRARLHITGTPLHKELSRVEAKKHLLQMLGRS